MGLLRVSSRAVSGLWPGSGLWFSIFTGLLLFMGLSSYWLALDAGSLEIVACYFCWFSYLFGLLLRLVLFDIWLAFIFGSLTCLACYRLWFSGHNGLLLFLVLSY